MAKAIIDPEELRAFATALQQFNDELSSQMMTLYMRYKALGETWQDQEQARFAEEFEQGMKNLKRFVDISSAQAPILVRKADKIDEYFNQR